MYKIFLSLILIILICCLGTFLWIILGYRPEEPNSLGNTEAIIQYGIMFGSLISAFGLIWFSSLAYQNQRKDSFINTFDIYIKEHNRLLNEIFFEKEFILTNTLSNYLHQKNLHNKTYKECLKDFVKDIFYTDGNISRYFIIVYRILKLVDDSSLTENEKKEYSGVLRTIIPFDIQFFIAINSLYDGTKNTQKTKYQILLEKYHFLEHVPLTEKWLEDKVRIFLLNNDLSMFRCSLVLGEIYSKEIWGNNVYIK